MLLAGSEEQRTCHATAAHAIIVRCSIIGASKVLLQGDVRAMADTAIQMRRLSAARPLPLIETQERSLSRPSTLTGSLVHVRSNARVRSEWIGKQVSGRKIESFWKAWRPSR